ncbi:nuclear transport factor 2 family protein [Nocardia fusca]|uniref:nuclear transport factor 2 family protein n=1 Tax=Nocardia fusca TaxID=941183 RepID=UPI0037ADD904
MTRTAEEIIDHHVAALAAGDVDAIVADYAEDARFVTADGVVAGRTSLAKTIAGIVDQFPGFTVTIVNLIVDDDIVLLEWTADTQGHATTGSTPSSSVTTGSSCIRPGSPCTRRRALIRNAVIDRRPEKSR